MEKLNKAQNNKNIAMNLLAFSLQFIITFYTMPIIVDKIGASANGFIGLANDFVSYASILATVFNSVAARFIANFYYKNDYKTANEYFNSLIITNLVLSLIISIVGGVVVLYLQKILVIPSKLIVDVKITFLLVFISYIVSLATLVFTTSTFIANRTDVQGARNIIQYATRFILILLLLNICSIKMYWIPLSTLISTILVAVMNVSLTKKLTPYLKINLSLVSIGRVAELAKAGSWMAFTSISGILLRGLDLTIANISLGDYPMGLLAISRSMPNNFASVISVVAPIFTPLCISYYVKNDFIGLKKNVIESVKIMVMILFVPLTGYIVFCEDFLKLWQSSLNQNEIMIVSTISIITIVQSYFDIVTSTMAQLSVVVNKLKFPVIISFGTGILSLVIELILLNYTSLGLYAIVLPTSIIIIARYLIFNPIYAAYCINISPKYFYRSIFESISSIFILFLSMYIVKRYFTILSWKEFVIAVFVCALIGYIEVFLVYKMKVFKRCLRRMIRR